MIHGRPGRITLVALYGMGDSYLLASLSEEVRKQTGQSVTVVLKDSHAAIGRLFEGQIRYETEPDSEIARVENDGHFHQTYENRLEVGCPFFVHPHFVRSGVRIDRLCLKPSVTHADMFRAMLQLDPGAPLSVPDLKYPEPTKGTVLLCREASSWPNTAPKFWNLLESRLRQDGWSVSIDDKSRPIGERLSMCAGSEWVIGPQFGLMAVICAAQFKCRKTLVSPSIDGGRYPGLPLKSTFPYAYVKTYAGFDYGLEEYKVTDENAAGAVQMIADSKGTSGNTPKITVSVDLSPGEFFDRLSIVTVKMARLPAEKRARINVDYLRLSHLAEPLVEKYGAPLVDAYQRLLAANDEVFVHNDVKVAASLRGDCSSEFIGAHAGADKASLRRMGIKQEINRICNSAFDEVKSFI